MSSYSEGQTHQLMEALKARGCTPAQVTALGQNSNGVLDQLMLVLAGIVKVVTDLVFRLVAKTNRDMTGWECLEPVPAKEGEFEVDFVEFVREGDNGYVSDEEMLLRAKEQGALAGLWHAEAILRNQERIPVGERGHVLVFSELWRGPDGDRGVWCLQWDGENWFLRCHWFGIGFRSRCRIVRPREYQK